MSPSVTLRVSGTDYEQQRKNGCHNNGRCREKIAAKIQIFQIFEDSLRVPMSLGRRTRWLPDGRGPALHAQVSPIGGMGERWEWEKQNPREHARTRMLAGVKRAPYRIRTGDLQFTRQTLWPAELRRRTE